MKEVHPNENKRHVHPCRHKECEAVYACYCDDPDSDDWCFWHTVTHK